MRIDGKTFEAGSDRCHYTEINSRLIHLQATGNVDEHIVSQHLQPHAFFEHGHQQSNAILVHALCHAPPRSIFCL
jgi:hypothetical protein